MVLKSSLKKHLNFTDLKNKKKTETEKECTWEGKENKE